ncbi:MAG: hypothetical protein BGO98_40980 [Myxococcales bacterium 68-20]|nr:MAG: hypothetical protein BGO98_40980 [Myxococcales bacterium 68-20]
MVMLIDALQRVGVDPAQVLDPLDLDRNALLSPRGRVAWTTLTSILGQLSMVLLHDVERLRDVGRSMTLSNDYPRFRRLAEATLSLRRVYEIGLTWITPANFPHLRIFTSSRANGPLRIHGSYAEPYEPSLPFFHIAAGTLSGMPIMLGLPAAKIVEAETSSRSLNLVLELPPRRARVRAGIKAVLGKMKRRRLELDVLEEERRLLADGLESLQRMHREKRTLLERLPDMVVVHVNGRIVYANQAFVQSLRWSSLEELVGRPLIELIEPRSRALVSLQAAPAPDAPGSRDLTRVRLLMRDGRPLLVELGAPQAVVFDGNEAQLVVGRDIEERVRLQEQLAAADRLASLGLLAAGVAHEVNNPLAYVLNNIELARRQLSVLGPSAASSVTALTIALEGVDRIRFIVRELLLLSRDEGSDLGPTDIRAVVESTLSLAAGEIERTAKLELELGDAPLVIASVPRLAQVVLNLLLNAIEAMRSSKRATNVLTVRLARSERQRVSLEISDTGVGITDDDLPRIFEPFFTTKPAGKGTGLGLSITQRVVVELGGEIEVTSIPERGTTFRVLLLEAPAPDDTAAG